MDNFDNIFEELTPLKKNSRYATQDCDLLYNPEKGTSGKFEVSDELFRRLDLNNHGFVVLTGKGKAFVGIVPNEDAITYAGRTDSENKSDEFTSNTMKEALDAVGLEGNKYWLTHAGTKDNTEYYQVVTSDPNDDKGDDILFAADSDAEEKDAQLSDV